jgi:anti-sigma factor RsiW
MKHPDEEELIAYHDGKLTGGDGDALQREALALHLKECPECKAELDRIDAVLAALDTMSVPDPGEDYGQRVWKQIAPRLPEKRRRRWEFGLSKQAAGRVSGWYGLFEPRRLATFAAVAALVIVAFLAGRRVGPTKTVADAANVRERVLIMAVGEHLGRSEMVLVELANAEPADRSGAKQVNIASEQRRAEDLLEENRLYRQTAMEQGDTALAAVLDELERVLLDVAHSPQQVSAAQLETIRERIAAKGILFKVRVVGQELQHRGESAQPPPGERRATKTERKKT